MGVFVPLEMTSSMMSSRLVETVMINVDDFADNFLTCGTCFSGYNSNERAAKLLPCSHTICRSCLDRILSNEVQSETFRCPICRENIAIPSGGASSFPPAFIVNQLLDLLATQRRDVVPKCCIHPSQELLFCETCDMVFCSECRGRNHAVQNFVNGNTRTSTSLTESVDPLDSACLAVSNSNHDTTTPVETSSSNAGLNHNVITFNVALRRCSEIMLYKMHLCIQELNCAQQAVSGELDRLANNTTSCVESINSRFSEILALVEHRQGELLDSVKRLGEEKRRALTDQLSLIETERDLIRNECDRLKGVLDVRSITKTISYLNNKLDSISGLTEPRENAFLRYQDCVGQSNHHNHRNMCCAALKRSTCSSSPSISSVTNPTESNIRSTPPYHRRSNVCSSSTLQSSPQQISLPDIARCLAGFGRLVVSTTYPALCTARLPSEMFVHLNAKCTIQAVDYHGRPQSNSGTDPIEVTFTDPRGHLVPTDLLDIGNGCYELSMTSPSSGTHKLTVQILNRPIRGSPFSVHVKTAQKRMWILKEGSDGRGLIQPFAVAFGPYPVNSSEASSDNVQSDCPTSGCFIYVLDTGNSRLLVLSPEDGSLHSTVTGEALSGQAATGMVWSPQGLWIVNWRAKQLFLLDPSTEQILSCISSPLFKEPTSITRCPLTNRLFVADNGAGCVFVCHPETGSVNVFIGTSATPIYTESNASTPVRHITLSRNETSSHLPQPRMCKLITGLCVTDSGEVILSTGTCVRIFSSEGRFLADLLPPSQPNEDFSRTRISTLPSRASLDASYFTASHASHDNQDGDGVNLDRLSLSELRQSGGSVMSRSPSSRGQFGGVTLGVVSLDTENITNEKLGKSILASYSDRKRSGVVVWPESLWTSSCQQFISEVDDDMMSSTMALNCHNNNTASTSNNVNNNSNISNNNRLTSLDANHQTQNCAIYCPLNRNKFLFKPYLIEVDPPFRRLAGLVTLPNCRDVIVVDQGAQNISRIHYA